MPDKQKAPRTLYTLSPLTIAQIAQLQIWTGKKKSALIRDAVDDLFEKISNEQDGKCIDNLTPHL